MKKDFSMEEQCLNFRPNMITVAQDGAGDYKTIQAAFDAIGANDKKCDRYSCKKRCL